jgi:hypothetical protein
MQTHHAGSFRPASRPFNPAERPRHQPWLRSQIRLAPRPPLRMTNPMFRGIKQGSRHRSGLKLEVAKSNQPDGAIARSNSTGRGHAN